MARFLFSFCREKPKREFSSQWPCCALCLLGSDPQRKELENVLELEPRTDEILKTLLMLKIYFKSYINVIPLKKKVKLLLIFWTKVLIPDTKMNYSFILFLSVYAEFPPPFLLNNNSNNISSQPKDQTKRKGWYEHPRSSLIKQCPLSWLMKMFKLL